MLSAEQNKSVSRRGLGRRALLGTAGAVLGVTACFVIASVTGAMLTVAVRGTVNPVPVGAAVVATAAAGGAAYLLARLAGRTARPRRTFLLVSTAGLLASAVPPLQAATSTSTAVWLLVMHAVAALGLMPVVAAGLPTAGRAGASGSSSRFAGSVPSGGTA